MHHYIHMMKRKIKILIWFDLIWFVFWTYCEGHCWCHGWWGQGWLWSRWTISLLWRILNLLWRSLLTPQIVVTGLAPLTINYLLLWKILNFLWRKLLMPQMAGTWWASLMIKYLFIMEHFNYFGGYCWHHRWLGKGWCHSWWTIIYYG